MRSSLTHSLIVCSVLLALFASAPLDAQEGPVAGRTPGTECWMVWLRDRSYDLRARIQQIRAAPTPNERTTLLNDLDGLVRTDQAELARLVSTIGGTVLPQYWVLSALAVEVPPAALPALRAYPRVRRLVPVRARGPASTGTEVPGAVPPLPIGTSTDSNNHAVAAARAILQNSYGQQVAEGSGVVIAVFDSGIDQDASGDNGNPPSDHPSFLNTGGTTRILAHLRAGMPIPTDLIDCNIISVNAPGTFPPTSPFAYRPCLHSGSAKHGTAMAGIAAGRANGATGTPDGHAPSAGILDVAITHVTDMPAPLYQGGFEYRDRWTTFDPTMLDGIQLLRTYILQNAQDVHVLNYSFDGWSDPDDPVAAALDQLALDEDILVVVSAGNTPDETRFSMGSWNAMAVGSVLARSGPSAEFVAMAQTARGPLNSDWRRFYPDVCATGAGTMSSPMLMPIIDPFDPASITGTNSTLCSGTGPLPFGTPVPAGTLHQAIGTSEAAAQVTGAAALYRAAREAAGGGSAEEARAAILLNLLSPYPGTAQNPYPAGNGAGQHTYRNRNTYGLGYVRDDFLAEFAVRDPAIDPLHQVVTLTPSVPSATVTYNVSEEGERYAVAVCWPRYVDEDMPTLELANVDLEVWDGTTLVARSASLANSYERVAFRLPAIEAPLSLTVRLAEEVEGLVSLPVQIVARRFEPDMDPATAPVEFSPTHAGTGMQESLTPGAGCTNVARDLRVTRVVPQVYADAYGSRLASGYNLANVVNAGATSPRLHMEITAAQVGNAPLTIGGISFRTWTPFPISGPLNVSSVKLETTQAGPVNQTSLRLGPSTGATTVLNSPVSLTGVSTDWVATGFNRFPLLLPFDADFVYGGGNLHIWIDLPLQTLASYYVDAAGDTNENRYGLQYPASQPGGVTSVESIGTCPIVGLLPGTATADMVPELRAFGEPWLGRSLELQVIGAPALAEVWLVTGGWSPGVGMPCAQHVSPVSVVARTTDRFGFARWDPWTVPNSTVLLHTETAFQVYVVPTSRMSNAILVTIGGGL